MKTRSNSDKLIDRYLSRLDRALGDLPSSRRGQIIEDVASHITEGRSALDDEDETSIRALLDRVGDPDAIAEEAGVAPASARRADAWVPWLLLLGGFAFVVGWFVGVGLLWSSRTWQVRDKLLGTFVLPGGLFGLVVLTGRASSVTACSGSSQVGQRPVMHCVTSGFSFPLPVGILVLVIVLVAPIITAVHLERVRRRS
jgi:hypothetical protein